MTIRITHGGARVELDSFEYTFAERARTSPMYPTDDLLEAVRRALLAADDARSDAIYDLLTPAPSTANPPQPTGTARGEEEQ